MPTAVAFDAPVLVLLLVMVFVATLASVVKPALKPLRSNTPVPDRLSPPLFVKTFAPPDCRIPPETVVSPV